MIASAESLKTVYGIVVAARKLIGKDNRGRRDSRNVLNPSPDGIHLSGIIRS